MRTLITNVVSEMVASDEYVRGDAEARLRAEGEGVSPHVVQLAGCDLHWMGEAARLAEASGAAVIDMNMGCPAKRVTGGYAGSALMRDLELATKLIAIAGLARHSDSAALDCLAAAARSETPDLRDAAVSLLADRTDHRAADVLVELALTADERHPVHAALSRPSPARIKAITARCETADEREAGTLTAALVRMRHPDATAALHALAALPSPLLRRVVAVALVRTGQARAIELVARMSREDPDPTVRHVCMTASEGKR